MQVADHLKHIADKLFPTSPSKSSVPRVSVGAVIGGIDSHKQMRIIGRGMDVMVATPGRLWDIIQNEVRSLTFRGDSSPKTEGVVTGLLETQDDSVAESIRRIKFLVLDEADRMIETGHFAELEKIVKLTFRTPEPTDQYVLLLLLLQPPDPRVAETKPQKTSSNHSASYPRRSKLRRRSTRRCKRSCSPLR